MIRAVLRKAGQSSAGHGSAGLARIPLRFLLVGTMVLLVLVGLVASGAAVTVTMRAQLLDRVDEQLIAAADGWVHRPPPGLHPLPLAGGLRRPRPRDAGGTAAQIPQAGAAAAPGRAFPPDRLGRAGAGPPPAAARAIRVAGRDRR